MKKITAAFLFLFASCALYASDISDTQRNVDTQYREMLRQREIDSRTNFIKEDENRFNPPEPAVTDESRDRRTKHFSKIEVIFKKIPKITAKKINKIIAPYQNKALSINEINIMQEGLQRLYLGKGYASARIYIDGNTFSEDVLTFVVHEGYIEDVIFKKKNGEPYSKTANDMLKFSFFPFAKDTLLNIRDLDQGLEQVNKLFSNNAVMEVLPGSKDGYSLVEINNYYTKRFCFTLGADNSGLENSGVYKANASISADNLLMLSDNFYFNYSRNIDGNDSDKENNSYFASLTVPFGYFSFMFSYFNSDYSTPAGTSLGKYTSDGSTENMNASLEMTVKRAQNYKLSAGAEMALKETENKFAGEKIEVSSKKLTVASAFLTSTHYIKNAMIYTKFSYNRGLDAFAAAKNKNIKGYPKGQFDAYSAYIMYSQPFKMPLLKLPLSYSAAVNAQYSPDILYSSEQITVGGESSVRGFQEGSVSGDSGGYFRNDLNVLLADIFKRNGFLNLWRYLSLGVFADYGYARHEAYGKDYQIGGAGTGLSLRTRYFSASGSWSRMIYNESNLEDEGSVFYVKVEAKVYF